MATPTKFLPTGWTEERLANATDEDWDSLTDNDWLGLRERWAAETWEAINASKEQSQLSSDEGASTSNSQKLAPFVEAIRAEHLDGEWGFVIFRTTYENNSDWPRFMEQWNMAIEEQMDPQYGDGIEDVKSRLRFQWVDDRDKLSDAGPDEVRRYFHDMQDRGEIPTGLDWPICLSISEECLQSLLNAPDAIPQPSEAEPRSHQNWPFAFAVDVDYDPDDTDDEDYHGDFKVAIGTILHELFPVIARQILQPEELAATLEHRDEVWIGV